MPSETREKTHCCHSIITKLTISIIGTIVGVSVFPVFASHYHNWNAGLWGLLSGIVAFSVCIIHIVWHRGGWNSRHTHLRYYMLTGCFIQLAGVCGFVAYLVLALTLNQALTPYDNGYYVTMVWCFMTWKWGFAMFIYSRIYRNETTRYHQKTFGVNADVKQPTETDSLIAREA